MAADMRTLPWIPFILLWACHCLAGEVAEPPAERVPLARFMAEDRPLRLVNASAELRLSVPVGPRMQIDELMLHLEATNSTALLPERSRLAVVLNGRTLAQITLHPDRPEITADIRLPPQLLKNGYNELAFRAAQHYTLSCEDPAAPELWTEIDAVRSTLAWKGTLRPLPLTLARLGEVFDARLWGSPTYNILTVGKEPTGQQARWGALAAQGTALYLRYRSAELRHLSISGADPPRHQTEDPGSETERSETEDSLFPGIDQASLRGADSILIGTRDELGPLLSESLARSITGAFLGVFPLDSDPAHVVLVIAGTDSAEVGRAALAFAMGHSFAYPDTPSMVVTGVAPPALQPYSALAGVYPGQRYRFADLDFRTATTRGESLALNFSVPPDLYVRDRSEVDLRLHFAYGAGLRGDSVLNILINGFFSKVVRFGEQEGASYRDYRVPIPLSALRPGRNTITFEPRMVPMITGECEPRNGPNLLFTLFEDSMLVMPDAVHYTRLPDLGRFASTLFPYAVAPDGSQLAVYVLERNSATLAAAWMVLAKMAQQNGAAMFNAHVSFAEPRDARHLIVVGPVDRVPPALLSKAPARVGSQGRVPYPTPLLARAGADEKDNGWLERIVLKTEDLIARRPFQRHPPPTLIAQSGGLGSGVAVMQFESPLHAGLSVVLFTAQDRPSLHEGIAELVRPESWGAMQGDFFVWRASVADSVWQFAGATWHVGDAGPAWRLEYYVSSYPWAWLAALLGAVVLMAWSIARALRAYRERHHRGVVEQTEASEPIPGIDVEAP